MKHVKRTSLIRFITLAPFRGLASWLSLGVSAGIAACGMNLTGTSSPILGRATDLAFVRVNCLFWMRCLLGATGTVHPWRVDDMTPSAGGGWIGISSVRGQPPHATKNVRISAD